MRMQGTRFKLAFTGKKLRSSPVSNFFQNYNKDIFCYGKEYFQKIKNIDFSQIGLLHKHFIGAEMLAKVVT